MYRLLSNSSKSFNNKTKIKSQALSYRCLRTAVTYHSWSTDRFYFAQSKQNERTIKDSSAKITSSLQQRESVIRAWQLQLSQPQQFGSNIARGDRSHGSFVFSYGGSWSEKSLFKTAKTKSSLQTALHYSAVTETFKHHITTTNTACFSFL